MKIKKEKLEQITYFTPAWDKRDADPKKNYGIHCSELHMELVGKKGAVSFVLFTSWYLPGNTDIQGQAGTHSRGICLPIPADLGYHSLKPQYDGQEKRKCHILGKCYYDGSGLNADRPYEILISEGSKGLWKYLEKYYYQMFYA